jgi:hypothetical protein
MSSAPAATLLSCLQRLTDPRCLWVPKTSSAGRIDAKGLVSDASRSEGERVQAANSV